MSIVAVQLGQCGNQVGEQFYHNIAQDQLLKDYNLSVKDNENYKETVIERFFDISPGKRSNNDLLSAR